MTRLKDMDKGEVLVFKEMSWQTVRIEAKSTVSEELTPLRLGSSDSWLEDAVVVAAIIMWSSWL